MAPSIAAMSSGVSLLAKDIAHSIPRRSRCSNLRLRPDDHRLVRWRTAVREDVGGSAGDRDRGLADRAELLGHPDRSIVAGPDEADQVGGRQVLVGHPD